MALLLVASAAVWSASCRPASPPTGARGGPDGGLDAEIVLDLAIAFHDPEGLWGSGTFAFTIEEIRPGRAPSRSRLELANGERRFELETETGGRRLVLRVDGDDVTVRSDGEPVIDAAVLESLDATASEVRQLRDRYLFIYGLPMKLRDPGTLLASVARRTTFRGRGALELRVSYEPDVGSDRWSFFVDPLDYSLLGGRVEHAVRTVDDETIVFDGLVEIDGLRLPRTRRRTASLDGGELGTETIVRGDVVEEVAGRPPKIR